MKKKQNRFLIVLIFLIGFTYLWSRNGIAEWYVASSDLARNEGDYSRAMTHLDRAISLQPNSPGILASRGWLRLQMIISRNIADFEACIADFTNAIDLAHDQQRHQYLSLRALAYQHWAHRFEVGTQRSSKFRLALDDLKTVLADLSSPAQAKSAERASALNDLSYARGLANIDITQALIDIDEALEILDHLGQTKRVAANELRKSRSDWLDTRGYLRYRAGFYDDAKRDMEEAIRIVELQLESTLGILGQGNSVSVMYFHRGKIYEALDFRNLAELDLQFASQLGYPGNGVL